MSHLTQAPLPFSPEVLLPLINQFPVGLILCTFDGKFIYANEFLTQFLGYSNDDFLKLSYWDVTPIKYQAQELLQLANLKHTKRYGPYEKEYRNASGEHVPIRLNGMSITLQDQSYIWSIVEPNVQSSSPAHQQHCQRAYAIHTEKMEALQQVVAGVAHEVNNPINFIHGNIKPLNGYINDLLSFVQHCDRHAESLPMELRDQLEEMDLDYIQEDLPKILESFSNGSTRIRDVILALRRFTRLNHDGLKLTNIHESLDDCLTFLKHRTSKLKVKIIRQYDSIPEVECFAADLNQAFFNLLNNAIDAIETLDNPTITITTEVYGKHLAIRIQDNGIGIAPENTHHILNPFFTTKAVGSGTGLGLTIAHQIITEQHQGFLSFESQLGQGSEFMVQLPI